ncbi:MAG: APC family permease [Pirellulaceae bacterium]
MAPNDSQKGGLSLGLGSLVALVIANMIGSGLYTSSCYALPSLGTATRVLWVWGLGGVMALCGAVAYGALARRLPDSGGEYLYLSRLIHPSIGFLAGWISLVAGFTVPIAAAALVVGTYLAAAGWGVSFLGANSPGVASAWIASGLIFLSALLHGIHLQAGAWVQNGVVIAKLIGLVAFLVVAVVRGPADGWRDGRMAVDPLADASGMELGWAMLGSLVWISLSYTGFNASIYLAGELAPGDKRVTRSMWIAALVVATLYLLLNAVFLYAIPAAQVAGNESFVADAASAIGGSWLAEIVRWTIVLSSITSVLAMLMAGPRVYQQMARDGVRPRLLEGRGGVPREAIWIQAALSIAVVWASSLRTMIGYLGLTLSTCGALAIASLFWIGRRYPQSPRLTWWESLAAIVYLVFSALILLAGMQSKPTEFQACVATFAAGAIAYLLVRQDRRTRTQSNGTSTRKKGDGTTDLRP